MAFSSIAVANTILDVADERGISVTPLKLLKLVYFAHAWYLASTHKPLLNERIEAWKFGPVAPSVYHAFKHHRLSPIRDRAQEFDFGVVTTPRVPELREFLGRIVDLYGHFSGGELSALTHSPGSPWYKAWNEYGGKDIRGTDIRDEDIQSFFTPQLVR